MASIASTVRFRREQGALAGAGAAAAHVDRGNRGLIENDRGDAGGERGVVGVADADAGDIGEEIFHEAGPSRPQMLRPSISVIVTDMATVKEAAIPLGVGMAVSRHCERSEAIHGSSAKKNGCFVAPLLAMTELLQLPSASRSIRASSDLR